MGLVPFHLWLLRISFFLKKSRFIFIITMHKLFPLFFLRKILLRTISITILLLRITLIGIFIIIRSTLFFTLLYRSIIHTTWIGITRLMIKGGVFFYWRFYRILLVIMLSFVVTTKVFQFSFNLSGPIGFCWLLISGIPPFFIFWIKVYIFVWLLPSLGLLYGLLFIVVRVFALTSYYRSFHFGRLLELNFFFRWKNTPLVLFLSFWGLF